MYKNMVFDVGSVLVEYRWLAMLTEDHGMEREDALAFAEKIFGDPFWDEFDLENISYQEVIDLYIGKYPEDRELIRWFFDNHHLMHVGRPKVWERLHMLKKKGYKIFLLSNYSSVLFESHTKDADFLNDLDGGVISYQIHQMKPEAEIYKELYQRYGLKPEESLFFDDRPVNIEGAKNTGMDGVLVISEEQLLEEIDRLLEA